MENFRQKFIRENIEVCLSNKEKLDSWEKKFLANIQERKTDLTQGQYNKLVEIKDKAQRIQC